jgi:DNA-binding transcriptional LysR family regulator
MTRHTPEHEVMRLAEPLRAIIVGQNMRTVSEIMDLRLLRSAHCWRADGSLEWLLPQSATEYDGMFLYYPKRASLAPKLRAFIDVAKKTLKSFE